MNFSERRSLRRPTPPRILREHAPDDLRITLRDMIVGKHGQLGAYRLLSEALHRFPDKDIWSDRFAAEQVDPLIEELEWYEVFDLLEQEALTRSQIEAVNRAFERCGLAYEMVGHEIVDYDPEGESLQIVGLEDAPISQLEGEFAAVRQQYSRALSALRGRPADEEKAVGEALGALEGVARVLSGKPEFGASVTALFEDEPTWARALAASLKALYGYGSQVPGARHGRYMDPEVAHSEARFVVRACGAAICYLIDGNRAGRWTMHN